MGAAGPGGLDGRVVTQPDAPYDEASLGAIGRTLASAFTEMVANGMERGEALEVIKAWVVAMAQRPTESKE